PPDVARATLSDISGLVPASPPDVRQGSALPSEPYKKLGLCPRCGLRPENLGTSPNRGHRPLLKRRFAGRAEPCLTSGGEAGNNIRRRSREYLYDSEYKP